MIIPAIKLRLSVNSPIALKKTLLIKTPKIENTTANPKTKNKTKTIPTFTNLLLII